MKSLLLLLLLVSVCGAKAFIGQSSSTTSQAGIPDGWKKIDLTEFSFFGPSDLKDQKAHGIDSAVWEYRNRNLHLMFDYGMYPGNDFGPVSIWIDYHSEWISIDGKKAKLETYQLTDEYLRSRPEPRLKYFAAVYFPEVHGEKSTILIGRAFCVDPPTQESAKKMFLSIKFK